MKNSFFAGRAKKASAKGRSPPHELEVSPRSGLYLLVTLYNSFEKFIKGKLRLSLGHRPKWGWEGGSVPIKKIGVGVETQSKTFVEVLSACARMMSGGVSNL